MKVARRAAFFCPGVACRGHGEHRQHESRDRLEPRRRDLGRRDDGGGTAQAGPTGHTVAFRWTAAADMQGLADFTVNFEALGVSADGSVIAGSGSNPSGQTEARRAELPLAIEGDATWRWDGRANDGRAVAPGVYLVRVRSGGDARVTRLLRVE